MSASRLLALPGELRNQIYDYVFEEPLTYLRVWVLPYDFDQHFLEDRSPPLAQVCRQIQGEVQGLWEGKHCLRVITDYIDTCEYDDNDYEGSLREAIDEALNAFVKIADKVGSLDLVLGRLTYDDLEYVDFTAIWRRIFETGCMTKVEALSTSPVAVEFTIVIKEGAAHCDLTRPDDLEIEFRFPVPRRDNVEDVKLAIDQSVQDSTRWNSSCSCHSDKVYYRVWQIEKKVRDIILAFPVEHRYDKPDVQDQMEETWNATLIHLGGCTI